MDHFLSHVSIKCCIALALSAVGMARGDEALPSQDQALARALENHPDIVAAKAKVALAEAELYGKRIEVSRQVLGLFGSLKKLDAQIDVSKSVLSHSKQSLDKGGATDPATKDKLAAEVQASEAQLVETIGQREQAEKDLRLLIGSASRAADEKTSNSATAVARQAPQGPIVEKMQSALEKPIKLDFVEQPLQDVMSILTDSTGVVFSLQGPALEAAGIATDNPVTVFTSEVPLRAGLQAFEDAYPEIQFILRDYGVLVTTKEYSEAHGYAPVLEPSKVSATTFKSR